MADTTGVLAISIGRPDGIDDQLALIIQESEKRNQGGPAQAGKQHIGPRRISLFRSSLLQHPKMDNHEVLIDDRFDGSGLDETIEFMAPASPGGVKNGEDGSLPGGCLSLGSVKQGGGGPRRLRGGWTGRESGANGCGDCQAEGPASDHEPMIISAALEEQGARSFL